MAAYQYHKTRAGELAPDQLIHDLEADRFFPQDPANADYQRVLAWVAQGGAIQPAAEPPPDLDPPDLLMLRALRAVRLSLANIKTDMAADATAVQAATTLATIKPPLLSFMQDTGRLLDRADDLDQLLIQWIQRRGTDE